MSEAIKPTPGQTVLITPQDLAAMASVELTYCQLVERVKELEEALLEARSVLSSVCTSRHRRVVEDGVVLYTQTEDWCRWAEGEVLDKVRAALSKSLPNTVAETPK